MKEGTVLKTVRMTTMSISRYVTILTLQTLLLLIDFGINTFGIFFRKHNSVMLVLFIVQDLCLLIALTALLLTFFGTYIFQAGLIELLYERFRVTIVLSILYFISTTVIFLWMIISRWNDPLKYNWSVGMHIFYIIQRLMAPFYYYFYKRSALRISDPRFYADIDWEQPTTLPNK